MAEMYTHLVIYGDNHEEKTVVQVRLTLKQLKEMLGNEIVSVHSESQASTIETVKQQSNMPKHPEMVFVRNECKHIGVPIKDIVSLEANRSYCIIHLADGRSYQVTVPMKEVLDDLDSSLFKRIHRSFCVNLIHIKSIEATSILLDNKRNITIGRDYQDTLEKEFIFIGSRRRVKERHEEEMKTQAEEKDRVSTEKGRKNTQEQDGN